jgi:hypothetical protein
MSRATVEKPLEEAVIAGLSWRDLAVICVGAVFFLLHFALPPPFGHLISPWLVGSILVGWVAGRVAIDRIERS